jgi:transcriptional regulator GlxA family with amidase domain
MWLCSAPEQSGSTVEELAHHTQMDVRSLQRLFRTMIGGSPKWMIERCRMQEAAQRLDANPSSSLVEMALEMGYADQAQFNRASKASVGRSPRAFAEAVHR